MSVIHKKSNGGASTEIEKEVREVKAAGEQTAALLALSFKAQIVQDRAAGTNVISDAAILQSAEVIEYDEYADNHAYNTVGEIIKHNGRYYEIKAAHTSNAAAYPVETTFAYYRLIELSATGTLDDPIPYPETAGIVVNVVSGLYYSYATVLTEIGYIKANTDEIKAEQKEQRKTNTEFVTRLTDVEASAKQAHKRLDHIEKRMDQAE